MTRIEALKALLTKVEAGTSPSGRDWDTAFHWVNDGQHAAQAMHGSLDAAKALHKAVLSGETWLWGVTNGDEQMGVAAYVCPTYNEEDGFQAENECPARAWLIAILKALISIEESKE